MKGEVSWSHTHLLPTGHSCDPVEGTAGLQGGMASWIPTAGRLPAARTWPATLMAWEVEVSLAAAFADEGCQLVPLVAKTTQAS